MKSMWTTWAFAAAGLAMAATVWAGGAESQNVLSDLHNADQTEIQIGQIAQQKGTTDEVRTFGDRLVKDHTDADKQVMDLAQKDNITLTAPPSGEQKDITDLTSKTGSDFDKAFVNEMITDHKKDIAKLKNAEKNLPASSDTRELVAKVLPTLEAHLAQAQQIQQMQQKAG